MAASLTHSEPNGQLRIPEPTGQRKAKGETGERQLGVKLEDRSPSQDLAITSFGSEHLILSTSPESQPRDTQQAEHTPWCKVFTH